MHQTVHRCSLGLGLHLEAALALDIHEERVGTLYEPLELVLGLFELSWWVKKIDIAIQCLCNMEASDIYGCHPSAPNQSCTSLSRGLDLQRPGCLSIRQKGAPSGQSPRVFGY